MSGKEPLPQREPGRALREACEEEEDHDRTESHDLAGESQSRSWAHPEI